MHNVRTRRLRGYFVPLVAFCASWTLTAATGQTLKTVKERGSLICRVNPGLLGFSSRDEKGNWAGLDVDFCRALAAAIFNDAGKIQFVPLETAEPTFRRWKPQFGVNFRFSFRHTRTCSEAPICGDSRSASSGFVLANQSLEVLTFSVDE